MKLRFRSFNHRPNIVSVRAGMCCFGSTFCHLLIMSRKERLNNVITLEAKYAAKIDIAGSCDVVTA